MANSLARCVEYVLRACVPGDLMEAGTWRGGLGIWMHAVQRTFDFAAARPRCRGPAAGPRTVWLADSFQGVPPPRNASVDEGFDETHAWEPWRYNVSEAAVRTNFERFGVLDERVRFLPGFFVDSLPGPVERLALLRLDGDTYESTLDALRGAYALVSAGGIVIIDDFHLNGCRRAVLEYRAAHGITSPIFGVPEDYVYACRQHDVAREGACEAGMPRRVMHPNKPVQGAYWIKR